MLCLFIRERGNRCITVKKDGKGDFTTISEAVKHANAKDIIKVYPGIYNEIIEIPDNGISIIGVNKQSCIIVNTTGRYKNAPIYAYGNFTLENLTVKMTLDDVGDWKPTYEGKDSGETFPGYAIHIDHANNIKDNTIHKAVIRNCNFYSEAFPAAGVGINENQTIYFKNCSFVRNTQDSSYWWDRCQGAFVGHAANEDVNNQKIILEGCEFISNYGNAANFLMTLKGEEKAEITAINNMFWSEELKTGDCVDYQKGKSKLNEKSAGNTAECLNAE